MNVAVMSTPMTIWKYPLKSVIVPPELLIHLQHGIFKLWLFSIRSLGFGRDRHFLLWGQTSLSFSRFSGI